MTFASSLRCHAGLSAVVLSCVLSFSHAAFAAPLFNPPIFVPLPLTSAQPQSIAVADFNRDGNLDMVVASLCGATCDTGAISVFLGRGNGAFRTPRQLPGSYQTIAVRVGDFNNDGIPDIIALNRCHQAQTCRLTSGWIQVFLGNGDGTFQTPKSFNIGGFYSLKMALGDFNGDGKLDVAMSWLGGFFQNLGGFLVALGNGDGTFGGEAGQLVGNFPNDLLTADFNADGKLDLAVVSSNHGNVDILLGNGDGTFQEWSSFHTGPAVSLAAADMNGDGRLDLVVLAPPVLRIALGNGDGTFRKPNGLNIALGADPAQVITADFDGDGRFDMAVAAPGIDMLVVYVNRGNGNFKRQFFSTGSGPNALAAGDFNNDGALDVAVVDFFSNNVAVFLNAGSATAFQSSSAVIEPRN